MTLDDRVEGLFGNYNCDTSEDGEEDRCPLCPTPAFPIDYETSNDRPRK